MAEINTQFFYETNVGKKVIATALAVGMLATACAGSSESSETGNTLAGIIYDEVSAEDIQKETTSISSEEVELDTSSNQTLELNMSLPPSALAGEAAVEVLPDSLLDDSDWINRYVADTAAEVDRTGSFSTHETQQSFWRGVVVMPFQDSEIKYAVLVNPLMPTRDETDGKMLFAAPLLNDPGSHYVAFEIGSPKEGGSFTFKESGYGQSDDYALVGQENSGLFMRGVIDTPSINGSPNEILDLGDLVLRDKETLQQSYAFVVDTVDGYWHLVASERRKVYSEFDVMQEVNEMLAKQSG